VNSIKRLGTPGSLAPAVKVITSKSFHMAALAGQAAASTMSTIYIWQLFSLLDVPTYSPSIPYDSLIVSLLHFPLYLTTRLTKANGYP
jgi:hypothetical protein